MRGPEGPGRGGVTRCGRPPPQPRGKGGKSSLHPLRKKIKSWIVQWAALDLQRRRSVRPTAGNREMMDLAKTQMTQRRTTPVIRVAWLKKLKIKEKTKRELLGGEKPRQRSRFILKLRRERAKSQLLRKSLRSRFRPLRGMNLQEKLARIKDCGEKREINLDRWHWFASSLDCCLDIGGQEERMPFLVDKSIVPESLGQGMELYVESRLELQKSKFIMACLTLLRLLALYDICRLLHQHLGEVLNLQTLCPQPALRNLQNQTPNYPEGDVSTSKKLHPS